MQISQKQEGWPNSHEKKANRIKKGMYFLIISER